MDLANNAAMVETFATGEVYEGIGAALLREELQTKDLALLLSIFQQLSNFGMNGRGLRTNYIASQRKIIRNNGGFIPMLCRFVSTSTDPEIHKNTFVTLANLMSGDGIGSLFYQSNAT